MENLTKVCTTCFMFQLKKNYLSTGARIEIRIGRAKKKKKHMKGEMEIKGKK